MCLYDLEKEAKLESLDSQICLPVELNDTVEIGNFPMLQTEVGGDDFKSSSNLESPPISQFS